MNIEATAPADNAVSNTTATADSAGGTITGRAVFSVDMSAGGVVVRTAFLTEQNQVIEMPAVFPDLQYALAQIDSLRQIVIDRFAQAAQIGIQVMAAQAAQAAVQGKQPEVATVQDKQPEAASVMDAISVMAPLGESANPLN